MIEQKILRKKFHRCKVVRCRFKAEISLGKKSKLDLQGSPTLTLYLNCFCQKAGKTQLCVDDNSKTTRLIALKFGSLLSGIKDKFQQGFQLSHNLLTSSKRPFPGTAPKVPYQIPATPANSQTKP